MSCKCGGGEMAAVKNSSIRQKLLQKQSELSKQKSVELGEKEKTRALADEVAALRAQVKAAK